MKSISIIQPNASLLAIGAINQIRSPRYTAYRGPVAIYAAPIFPELDRMKLRNSPYRQSLLAHYPEDDLAIGLLPTGQIVGVGLLADCVEDESPFTLLSEPEYYVWKFENVRMLGEPIRCECGRGLAELSERIAARLEVFA